MNTQKKKVQITIGGSEKSKKMLAEIKYCYGITHYRAVEMALEMFLDKKKKEEKKKEE